MIFNNPLLRISCIRPVINYSVQHAKSLRPTIQVAKDRFQLCLNVRHFNKDELCVKAHPEYVIIEGKQEKRTHQGYALHQFERKFKLPEGCIAKKIQWMLSPDGMLIVTAPRIASEAKKSCEVVVPMSYHSVPDKNKMIGKVHAECMGPGEHMPEPVTMYIKSPCYAKVRADHSGDNKPVKYLCNLESCEA